VDGAADPEHNKKKALQDTNRSSVLKVKDLLESDNAKGNLAKSTIKTKKR